MNAIRPILLAALAALSLQACEVHVNSGDTKVQPPQAALPEDTQLNGAATTTAAAPPVLAPAVPPEAASPSEQPAPEVAPPPTEIAAAAPAALPAPEPMAPPASEPTALVQPATATLGAAAAVPAAPAASATPATQATQATPDAVTASAGSAAPTELALFIEANAPGNKKAAAPAAASGKGKHQKRAG